MRPAWAHSFRCESGSKLITTNEVKRNCVRTTERGKEARSVKREPRNTKRVGGGTEQAKDCDALVVKAK